MWTVEVEHVRVPGDGGAKVGIRSLSPLVAERRPVYALQAHARHPAYRDVKTSSDVDDVELMHRAGFQLDALLREALDRVSS